MPRKPKRPCSYPSCPKLTDGRFCEEHQKLENQRYEKYDRDPAAKRRYGRAWKRIRDRYMNAHPLSERCQREGVKMILIERFIRAVLDQCLFIIKITRDIDI